MLDRKLIREHPDRVRQAILDKRGAVDLDLVLSLDEEWRRLLGEVEQLKARRNAANEDIARRKQAGQDAGPAIAEMRDVSERIKAGDERITALVAELDALEACIPNLPDQDVPRGDERHNQVVRTWGTPRSSGPGLLPHWELGQRLGILDLEAAARMSGSGFILLKGEGARLERALINWFLDVHVREQGYLEMSAPYLVRDHALFGTGQLPKLADDMYVTAPDQLWLIPTAEVSVTNYLREQVLEGDQLPVRFVAFSPCFRREAGSAGKDTRGMLRVHQFHKVEMVRFTTPQRSEAELEELVADATVLLERLELPYRVVKLASGDLGFAAAKCYDLEVFSPGVDTWLEVSSCSNFRDFQSRRAQIRYRTQKGAKPAWVHTLNGSGLALPRMLVAVMENYQTKDGAIRVPEPLIPYMGGVRQIG
jgi:seryl-tRNA synthetase